MGLWQVAAHMWHRSELLGVLAERSPEPAPPEDARRCGRRHVLPQVLGAGTRSESWVCGGQWRSTTLFARIGERFYRCWHQADLLLRWHGGAVQERCSGQTQTQETQGDSQDLPPHQVPQEQPGRNMFFSSRPAGRIHTVCFEGPGSGDSVAATGGRLRGGLLRLPEQLSWDSWRRH